MVGYIIVIIISIFIFLTDVTTLILLESDWFNCTSKIIQWNNVTMNHHNNTHNKLYFWFTCIYQFKGNGYTHNITYYEYCCNKNIKIIQMHIYMLILKCLLNILYYI